MKKERHRPGKDIIEKMSCTGTMDIQVVGEASTPWLIILVLKLFGNNLEVFPGL